MLAEPKAPRVRRLGRACQSLVNWLWWLPSVCVKIRRSAIKLAPLGILNWSHNVPIRPISGDVALMHGVSAVSGNCWPPKPYAKKEGECVVCPRRRCPHAFSRQVYCTAELQRGRRTEAKFAKPIFVIPAVESPRAKMIGSDPAGLAARGRTRRHR